MHHIVRQPQNLISFGCGGSSPFSGTQWRKLEPPHYTTLFQKGCSGGGGIFKVAQTEKAPRLGGFPGSGAFFLP